MKVLIKRCLNVKELIKNVRPSLGGICKGKENDLIWMLDIKMLELLLICERFDQNSMLNIFLGLFSIITISVYKLWPDYTQTRGMKFNFFPLPIWGRKRSLNKLLIVKYGHKCDTHALLSLKLSRSLKWMKLPPVCGLYYKHIMMILSDDHKWWS